MIGIIGFIGTLIYQNVYGPPRVVVQTPNPNQPENKIIPTFGLVQSQKVEESNGTTFKKAPPTTSQVMDSSVPTKNQQIELTVLRSQIAIADKIFGTDSRNEEYVKIIDRALIANELDLALEVTEKLFGTDLRNDNYDKIIHKAIQLKRLDIAGNVASNIFGTDRRNAALKLILNATVVSN